MKKLSKTQQRALRRARRGLREWEVNADGNRRRTYLSLIEKGLLDWNVFDWLEPTKAGAKLLGVPPSAWMRDSAKVEKALRALEDVD